MPSRRVSRKHLKEGCVEPGPGDGLDPRLDRSEQLLSPTVGRKTLQLCSQIARCLTELLSSLGDDVLRDMIIVSVTPAKGNGRLLVTLAPAPSAVFREQASWMAAVARLGSLARYEVAIAIHRRKVPELVFDLQF
ncbi:MAG: hypothetical protein EBV06_08880 [Planctomycetia bacterium]|nr:hypothetical protein [Planctomycetia bacterium]